jgi:hypothetical protein
MKVKFIIILIVVSTFLGCYYDEYKKYKGYYEDAQKKIEELQRLKDVAETDRDKEKRAWQRIYME